MQCGDWVSECLVVVARTTWCASKNVHVWMVVVSEMKLSMRRRESILNKIRCVCVCGGLAQNRKCIGVYDLWTSENCYRWNKSLYGSQVSASVTVIRPSRLFSQSTVSRIRYFTDCFLQHTPNAAVLRV